MHAQLSSGPGGLTFDLNLCSYFVCASSEDWAEMQYVPKISRTVSFIFQDQYWRALIDYCVKEGAYTGCDLPPVSVTL